MLPNYFVQQGKYDCVAATIAMLTDHLRYTVIQCMAAHGWCNDKRGATNKIERDTIRDLGYDLIPVPHRIIDILGRDLPDGSVTASSLNYPGYAHALAWRDGKLLDPNTGRPGRQIWSPDSDPMVAIEWFKVLAERPLSKEEFFWAKKDFSGAETYDEAMEAVEKWAA